MTERASLPAGLPMQDSEQKILLEMAGGLVTQLQEGDIESANQTIYQLCKMRESALFQEIGKLTRELHDTLNSFAQDRNFEKLAQESLPDAKKRLDYVVQVTEESAHKTITVVEQSLQVVNDLEQRCDSLQQQFSKDSETSSSDVKESLQQNLSATIADAKSINASLIEVLMAQSYQDVTGQVIHRVIKLVQDIEISLVNMIRCCGLSGDNTSAVKTDEVGQNKKDSFGFGPVVPGVNHGGKPAASVENAVVQNQDDVDDLLSTLGF